MYKLYDFTEENFDCLLDAKKLCNNISKPEEKPQSLLEDEIFQKETKLVLLEASLRSTSVSDPEYNELLEDYIGLLYGEMEENQKETIKEKVKFEVKNASPIIEEAKFKYAADKYIKRNIVPLSTAIKNKK